MTTLPTNIVAGDLGHISHHNALHSKTAFLDNANDFSDDQRFASGRPWVDVTAAPYNADPTGGVDSTTAIQAAITFVESFSSGGDVYAPHGLYRITSLVVKSQNVILRGAGGFGQANSSAPYIRSAPTKFYSTADAVIVWFKEDDYTSIQSQHSRMEDIAIEGLRTATSQVGIKIDNRGGQLRNVQVAACGGIGIHIVDSVTGLYENVIVHHCNQQGWILDPTVGTDSANSAVTNNTFVLCSAVGNDNQGWVIQGSSWGNLWLGGDVESNGLAGGDAGIIFSPTGGGTKQPRFNKMRGMWDESNGGPCVRFDTNATDNEVEYVRFSSAAPSHGSGADRNLVHGSNVGAAGNAQKIKHMLGHILAWRGLDSSDLDGIVVRNFDDSADGQARLKALAFTYGLSLAAGADFPVSGAGSVPSFVDAACFPNNVGLTWRNGPGSGNIQGCLVDSTGTYRLPNGVAVGAAGTNITRHISGTRATVVLGTINAGTVTVFSINATGAALGDVAYVSPSDDPGAGLIWSAYPITDGVQVRVANPTGGNIVSTNRDWRTDVWKH